jgi:hypothetical protein
MFTTRTVRTFLFGSIALALALPVAACAIQSTDELDVATDSDQAGDPAEDEQYETIDESRVAADGTYSACVAACGTTKDKCLAAATKTMNDSIAGRDVKNDTPTLAEITAVFVLDETQCKFRAGKCIIGCWWDSDSKTALTLEAEVSEISVSGDERQGVGESLDQPAF